MKQRRISISPTLLNCYWTVMTGQFNTEVERLEDDIKGASFASPAMSRGTAIHQYIEEQAEQVITADGMEFRLQNSLTEGVREALRKYEQPLVFESWAKLTFQIEGVEVVMNMRLDAINYPEIVEFKSASKPKSHTDYMDSYQWRCYLLACPESSTVTYEVFVCGDVDQIVELKQKQTFVMHRYPTLEQDVKGLLTGFVVWLKQRPDLFDILEAKANR